MTSIVNVIVLHLIRAGKVTVAVLIIQHDRLC